VTTSAALSAALRAVSCCFASRPCRRLDARRLISQGDREIRSRARREFWGSRCRPRASRLVMRSRRQPRTLDRHRPSWHQQITIESERRVENPARPGAKAVVQSSESRDEPAAETRTRPAARRELWGSRCRPRASRLVMRSRRQTRSLDRHRPSWQFWGSSRTMLLIACAVIVRFRASRTNKNSHDSRSPDLPVKARASWRCRSTLRELLRFGPRVGSPDYSVAILIDQVDAGADRPELSA
jgi:hypothetical protein